jgi:hypothetical protein
MGDELYELDGLQDRIKGLVLEIEQIYSRAIS